MIHTRHIKEPAICGQGEIIKAIMKRQFGYVQHNKKKQVAQLSQRDRAQGGLLMAKSGRLELRDNIYGQYRSIFNYCDVCLLYTSDAADE